MTVLTLPTIYVFFCFFPPSHLLSWPFFSPSYNSDPRSHSRLFYPLPTTYGSCLGSFLSRRLELFPPSSTGVEYHAYPRYASTATVLLYTWYTRSTFLSKLFLFDWTCQLLSRNIMTFLILTFNKNVTFILVPIFTQ